MQGRPNAVSFALMKVRNLTKQAHQPYYAKDEYLTPAFVEKIPPKDRFFVDDTLTLNSYINMVELMDALQMEGAHPSPLESVTDPHLFIMPTEPHRLHDHKCAESLFGDYLHKVPHSQIVQFEGSHFDLVAPDTPAHQKI